MRSLTGRFLKHTPPDYPADLSWEAFQPLATLKALPFCFMSDVQQIIAHPTTLTLIKYDSMHNTIRLNGRWQDVTLKRKKKYSLITLRQGGGQLRAYIHEKEHECLERMRTFRVNELKMNHPDNALENHIYPRVRLHVFLLFSAMICLVVMGFVTFYLLNTRTQLPFWDDFLQALSGLICVLIPIALVMIGFTLSNFAKWLSSGNTSEPRYKHAVKLDHWGLMLPDNYDWQYTIYWEDIHSIEHKGCWTEIVHPSRHKTDDKRFLITTKVMHTYPSDTAVIIGFRHTLKSIKRSHHRWDPEQWQSYFDQELQPLLAIDPKSRPKPWIKPPAIAG